MGKKGLFKTAFFLHILCLHVMEKGIQRIQYLIILFSVKLFRISFFNLITTNT